MNNTTPDTNAILEYLRVQFPATDGHIPLREKIAQLESERNELKRWKDEMMQVGGWWLAVDELIRKHPDAIVGHSVSDTALRFIRERDEARETLRNAEAELSIATAERDDFRRQVEAAVALSGKALRVLGALGCDASTTAEQTVEKIEAMREAIKQGQPTVPDEWGESGARMHIGCAAEDQDGQDLDRELGDS